MTGARPDGLLRRTARAVHGLGMAEDVALARALAKEVDVGKAIPVKWHQAVAEVLAVVYELKKAG